MVCGNIFKAVEGLRSTGLPCLVFLPKVSNGYWQAFGEKAEYMSRLKRRDSSEMVELKRRESSERVETTRSSVIVSVRVQEVNSRDSSPCHPPSILNMLPPHPSQYDFLCSEPLVETMSRDSDGCHLTLKTEPEVASPTPPPLSKAPHLSFLTSSTSHRIS